MMDALRPKRWFQSKTVQMILAAVLILVGFRVVESCGYAEKWMEDVRDAAQFVVLAAAGMFRVKAWQIIRGSPPTGNPEDLLDPDPTILGQPQRDDPFGGLRPRFLCVGLIGVLMFAPSMSCSSRAELAATRETMYESTKTIRKEHLAWTKEFGRAGKLRPEDVELREEAHKEFEDYVKSSRSRDWGDGSALPSVVK